MNRSLLTCLPLLFLAGGFTLSHAGDPTIGLDFDSGKLGPEWKIAKGAWQIEDGSLNGSEIETDEHAAVLTYQKKNRDSVIQFDFELHGAKRFSLSMNKARGHLWRVSIDGRGAYLIKDKDKKDPESKAERLAMAKVKLVPGKRYTFRAEIVGPQVAVKIGDSISLSGSHPSFDTDKPNIRFVVSGKSVVLDNLKIWEGKPER